MHGDIITSNDITTGGTTVCDIIANNTTVRDITTSITSDIITTDVSVRDITTSRDATLTTVVIYTSYLCNNSQSLVL